MKKILLGLTIALSCLGISRVKADTVDISYIDIYKYGSFNYVSNYTYLIELGLDDEVQELYNLLINEYKTSYENQYLYYYISLSYNVDNVLSAYLSLHNEIPILGTIQNATTDARPFYITPGEIILSSKYNISSSTYTTPYIVSGLSATIFTELEYYSPIQYFVSNFDLINNLEDTYIITGKESFTINPGDIIEPYYTADNAFQDNYTEINLNDYAYIALALKDYNQDAFSTNVQVKGQYCLTPVYNYGLTERKEILEGSKVDRCSPYYDNYTTVRTSILTSDLQNHAIYYLKAYDTSKDNYVKIDTTVFDVTLITEEEKDNPYVTVNGKTYPTIAYDELTDTATKSEDEGYVSGASEEFNFSDIFTAPLDFLKDVWDSISSVFDLIKELFSLLPEPLPTFLIISFTLAIILGLIKIIL